MSVKVTFQYSQAFTSPKKLEEVFSFLENYEKSIVPLFPGLKNILPIKNGEYRWDFETINQSGYKIDIDLTTRFVSEKPNKLLVIPVKGQTMLSSEFTLSEGTGSTNLDFKSNFETELAIPFFLKSVAQTYAEKAIRDLFVKYLSNVEKALK